MKGMKYITLGTAWIDPPQADPMRVSRAGASESKKGRWISFPYPFHPLHPCEFSLCVSASLRELSPFFLRSSSERFMRSVAKGTITAVLAAAEINRTVFLGGVRSRGEATSLVRAITEGLRGTLATGTPVIGLACFDGDGDRGFLSNDGFGHGIRWLG